MRRSHLLQTFACNALDRESEPCGVCFPAQFHSMCRRRRVAAPLPEVSWRGRPGENMELEKKKCEDTIPAGWGVNGVLEGAKMDEA